MVLAHLSNLELFKGTVEFENEKTRSEQLVFKKTLPGLFSWHRAKGSNSDTSWLEWVQKGKAYSHLSLGSSSWTGSPQEKKLSTYIGELGAEKLFYF